MDIIVVEARKGVGEMRINNLIIDIKPWKDKYPELKGKNVLKAFIRKEIGKQKAARKAVRKGKS